MCPQSTHFLFNSKLAVTHNGTPLQPPPHITTQTLFCLGLAVRIKPFKLANYLAQKCIPKIDNSLCLHLCKEFQLILRNRAINLVAKVQTSREILALQFGSSLILPLQNGMAFTLEGVNAL